MWNWCRISCRNPGRPCLCGFFLEHIFLYTSGDKNGRCCVLLIHNRGCNWKAVPADCWKACFQAEKAAPRTAETGKNVIVIQDIVILWCILFASMLIYWRKRCWYFVCCSYYEGVFYGCGNRGSPGFRVDIWKPELYSRSGRQDGSRIRASIVRAELSGMMVCTLIWRGKNIEGSSGK